MALPFLLRAQVRSGIGSFFVSFILSISVPSAFSQRQRIMSSLASNMLSPPVAKKVKHEMKMFGVVRIDNYYWLRDDSRSDPKVISYLNEENRYTESVMAESKSSQKVIYDELRQRIKEDDISAPIRRKEYYYYTKTLTGKEYVQYCRRLISNPGALTVYDVMPIGSDAPPEHIILDENVNSKGHGYYKIGAFKVSPNNKLVAYAEDTKGIEIYTVHIIDAETKSLVGYPLEGTTSDLEWAGNNTLVYTTMDETLRPDKAWRHKVGSEQSSDVCLYHEVDNMFALGLQASESMEYLFVLSASKDTSFIFYLNASNVDVGLLVLTKRVNGISCSATHRGNQFFITRRSEEIYNSELLVCPVTDVSQTNILLPHRKSVKIQGVSIFINNIVLYERENGLPKVTIYNFPTTGEEVRHLINGQSLGFNDPVYSIEPAESEFSSCVLRYKYSSLKVPPSVYDHDMSNGVSVLKKKEPVLGGFDESNYLTERIWTVASDGAQVPISVVYRKDLVKLDGNDPLLLYGYGSYEICIDASFVQSRLSLLDRGFIFAIAHVRGGGELGRQWYENGKLLKKKNTFTDFISCAEYLIERKYCSKEKICIDGRSAGGLLIGAVLNMRPDLFKVAVAGVPFVDVLTTMLDPTIPLTTSEYEEWGDPRKEEFYFYIKSYSPVDNIKQQNYPNILVTAGLNDPRVLYSEPAKFVAKLREMKKDDNMLLLKVEMGAGHFSKSGRYEKLEEDAFIYTFMLKALSLLQTCV